VNEFGKGMQAKLVHDSSSVRLHRPDSDAQLESNFLIRFSLRQESNYFSLAGGWPSLRIPSRFALIPKESLQYDVGNSGGQELLARRYIFHRLYQVLCKIGFQDEAKGSGIEDPTHHLVGLVHGEDNNFGSWDCLSNPASGLKPV